MAYQGNNNYKGGGNNNRPNNNQWQNRSGEGSAKIPKIEVPKIALDYEQQPQLFGEVAQKWSQRIEQEKTSTKNKINQIRGFYDKVMELNEKAQNTSSDEQYQKEVYPFIVMLNSKVAYAKSRDLISDTFVKMINQCVENSSNSRKKMNNFKLFFEAFIGFYPKK